MKYTLLALAIILAASCKDSTTSVSVRKDTVFTSVIYMENWRSGSYETGTAEKTWSEVLKPDPKDSTKNIKVYDSAYRLAIFFQVRDTLSKDSGRVVSVPKLDSVGIPVRRLLGLNPLPKQYIVKDFNTDLLNLK